MQNVVIQKSETSWEELTFVFKKIHYQELAPRTFCEKFDEKIEAPSVNDNQKLGKK